MCQVLQTYSLRHEHYMFAARNNTDQYTTVVDSTTYYSDYPSRYLPL
jgi:hypothetical protein